MSIPRTAGEASRQACNATRLSRVPCQRNRGVSTVGLDTGRADHERCRRTVRVADCPTSRSISHERELEATRTAPSSTRRSGSSTRSARDPDASSKRRYSGRALGRERLGTAARFQSAHDTPDELTVRYAAGATNGQSASDIHLSGDELLLSADSDIAPTLSAIAAPSRRRWHRTRHTTAGNTRRTSAARSVSVTRIQGRSVSSTAHPASAHSRGGEDVRHLATRG